MFRFLTAVLLAGFLTAPAGSLHVFPVSRALLQDAWAPDPNRAQPIDVLHYLFDLTLSDANDEIHGRAEVTVRFLETGLEGFSLHLVGVEGGSNTGMEVVEVSRRGVPLDFVHAADRLAIPLPSPSRTGEEDTFQVLYRGIPRDGLIIGDNMHGDRAFFGDNWPNRARHWLPTVDHPSDKATVEWLVTAPAHYDVVGTGRLLERKGLGEGMEFTHWSSTVPISTKVMVMGAARFAHGVIGHVDTIPIQAWVYPQDSLAGFHDFARAEEAVRFFQDHVGPFPYAKLANVQSKTRYGGMENAGNIFYSERAIRGDGTNEGLIVHEVAHQWFGDSVTESDWPHLWLSEGFATYFTHLYDEATYGRESLEEGMLRDRRTVRRFLAQRPALALVPADVTDPYELLNENAYQKGSWVLHMLRREVGDSTFWAGIRNYYRVFRDQTADTDEFQGIMEEVAGRELGWFFQQWVHEPGHPVLEMDWSYREETGTLALQIRQVQETGATFRFPLDIGLVYPGRETEAAGTLVVDTRESTFTIPVRGRPEDLILDPDCWLLFEGHESGGDG